MALKGDLMSTNEQRYQADIETVAQLAEARGDTDTAQRWRQGAADFLAGRTGCHNWASARREIDEASR